MDDTMTHTFFWWNCIC